MRTNADAIAAYREWQEALRWQGAIVTGNQSALMFLTFAAAIM